MIITIADTFDGRRLLRAQEQIPPAGRGWQRKVIREAGRALCRAQRAGPASNDADGPDTHSTHGGCADRSRTP